MLLQVQILPGVDQYLSRGIQQLGDTLSLFFETDRRTQRAIRDMLIKNPDLVQDFADLEARAPGSLKRLGFGRIADLVRQTPESVEQATKRATRGDVVAGARAEARGARQRAEFDVQAFETILGQTGLPEDIQDKMRTSLGLETVNEKAARARKEAVDIARHPSELAAAEAAEAQVTNEIGSIADALIKGQPVDPKLLDQISRDPNKFKIFQEIMQAKSVQSRVSAPDRLTTESVIQGAAIEAFRANPRATPEELVDIVSQNPAVQATGAPREQVFAGVSEAIAPRTEIQSRVRQIAPGAYQGVATIDRLENQANAAGTKAPGLGVLERLVQTDRGATGAAGGLFGGVLGAAAMGARTGALIGGATTGPGGLLLGAVGGALTGGLIGAIGAPVVRGIARTFQDEESQLLWHAAQNIAAAVYRRESGAAVKDSEIRTVIERYLPLSTDGPAVREEKRILRQLLVQELELTSGLPNQFLGPPGVPAPNIQAQLEQAEQRVEAARQRDAANTVAPELQSLLLRTNNNAQNALSSLRQEAASRARTGRTPNPRFNEVSSNLERIAKLDSAVVALRKTGQVEGEIVANELLAERDILTGGPVSDVRGRIGLKPLTPDQIADRVRTELVDIDSKLPSIRGDSAYQATRQRRERLQQILSGSNPTGVSSNSTPANKAPSIQVVPPRSKEQTLDEVARRFATDPELAPEAFLRSLKLNQTFRDNIKVQLGFEITLADVAYLERKIAEFKARGGQ